MDLGKLMVKKMNELQGLSRLLDTKHKRLLFKMNSSYELYSATMKKIVD